MKLDESHRWVLTQYGSGKAAECHSCGARPHWPLAQARCPSRGYRSPMPAGKARATLEEVYEAIAAMEAVRGSGHYKINHAAFRDEFRGRDGFKY